MNLARITLPLVASALLLSTGLLAQNSTPAQPAAAKTATTKAAAKPATATKAPAPLTTDKEKASYAIGADMVSNFTKYLEHNDVTIDKAALQRGFRDALNKAKLQMTEEERKAAISKFTQDAKAHAEAREKAKAEFNKVQGENFLKENKTKPGVTTLDDGLQYKVITQGTGAKPVATDTVEVNYRGTLVDGKEFDSSAKHGGPATFPANRVIKGWTEILQLMPVGSRYEVYIPSELAYGPRGSGPDIGPNAALVFEIELLSIKTPAAQPPAQPATQPATPQPLTPPPAPKQ